MIKIITNPAFISNKTGLAFDVVLHDIKEDEEGFTARVDKVYKNIDGTYSEEAPPKSDTITIKKANEQNLYNSVVAALETKAVNKYTT